jgi:hypothetical protein
MIGGSNVDTDVIVSEEPPAGSTRKPEELYGIIERFSQVWLQPSLQLSVHRGGRASLGGGPAEPFTLRGNACAYLCSQAIYSSGVPPAVDSRALTGTIACAPRP